MTENARPREDVRLESGPMVSILCTACGARVQARKSSWDQTTVQWDVEAIGTCVERQRAWEVPGANGAVFRGCHALRAALREAAVSGILPVVDPN